MAYRTTPHLFYSSGLNPLIVFAKVTHKYTSHYETYISPQLHILTSMFSSLRSKFTSRGSILEDTSPFEPAQSSAFEPTQPASSEPAKPLSAEDERANDIRRRCNRFRILIIGRANAGKTTILQKVCNSTKKPVIYNSKGKRVGSANGKLY